jgi:hypothetical protein
MPISTLDALAAGALPPFEYIKAVTPTLTAGRPQSLWALGGNPGAGAFDTTLNGVALTAPVNGQIPWSNPTSPALQYLARFEGSALQAGRLLLCDRLWHNGGFTITSTSAQSITSPTFPARDNDGSTDGRGVLLGLEISAATGAGTPTVTVAYTNSGGTGGRSATNVIGTGATSAAGSFYPIGRQAGDLGVRSVQSLTLSATWTSGTMNLVAYRVLASVPIMGAGLPGVIDAVIGGQQRLYDGTVPFLLFIPSTTTAVNLTGQLITSVG